MSNTDTTRSTNVSEQMVQLVKAAGRMRVVERNSNGIAIINETDFFRLALFVVGFVGRWR